MHSRKEVTITNATSVQISSDMLYFQPFSPSARLPLGHNNRRHVVSIGGNGWIMSWKTCTSQGLQLDGGGIPRQGSLEGCHILSAVRHLICGLQGV